MTRADQEALADERPVLSKREHDALKKHRKGRPHVWLQEVWRGGATWKTAGHRLKALGLIEFVGDPYSGNTVISQRGKRYLEENPGRLQAEAGPGHMPSSYHDQQNDQPAQAIRTDKEGR